MIIPAIINALAICDGTKVLAATGTTSNGAFTAIKLKTQSSGRLETVVAKPRSSMRKTASHSYTTKRAAWTFVDTASQTNSGCAISVIMRCTNRGSIL